MYLGIDYHGVITDTAAHKQRHAYEMFGVELAPEQCSREAAIATGRLTTEQYATLLKEIYFTDKALDIPPQPTSVEAIGELSAEHGIHIVTGSDAGEMPFIRRWLVAHNLGQFIVSTAGYRGLKYIAEFDLFVDDKPKVLERLKPYIPRLLLFNQPYNRSQAVSTGVHRIDSLYELETVAAAAPTTDY